MSLPPPRHPHPCFIKKPWSSDYFPSFPSIFLCSVIFNSLIACLSSMDFCVEEPIAGLTIGQAIYEVTLIIALLRWVLCWGHRIIKDRRTRSLQAPAEPSSSSSCSFSWVSSLMVRDTALTLTTFGELVERLPDTEDTCAVCLNQLRMQDEVRELLNCYHVFHKECIDRWLDHDHDNHNPTCPLCRAPLFTPYCPSSSSESSSFAPPPQPSWAVERLLYLFGDDLLP